MTLFKPTQSLTPSYIILTQDTQIYSHNNDNKGVKEEIDNMIQI